MWADIYIHVEGNGGRGDYWRRVKMISQTKITIFIMLVMAGLCGWGLVTIAPPFPHNWPEIIGFVSIEGLGVWDLLEINR